MLGYKIRMVHQNEELIIEKFRQYHHTLTTEGAKIKILKPFEKVAARISTALRQEADTLGTKTKDDIFVQIPITMHFQVVDSKKYFYNAPNPDDQMKIRVNATVKQLASGMDFIELYQTREQLSFQAVEKVGKELEDLYGIKLKDVIVDQPSTTAEAMKSFSGVKESERNKATLINDAAGRKAAQIAEAEGDKESRILRGQGAAGERAAILDGYADQFNHLVSKGIPPEMVQEMVKLAMINDTIRDAATHGNLIITTTNSQDMLSQIQTLGKARVGGNNSSNDDQPAGKPAPGMKPSAP